jgi:N-acyl-D-amino-acid deacylase
MSFDTTLRGGTIVDGTGSKPYTGDIGIVSDRIVAVGGKLAAGKQDIDVSGATITPGWVDVHTHYDAQATWDPYLSPSTDQGVTSVVMGNCGVGFAPVHADKRDWLNCCRHFL